MSEPPPPFYPASLFPSRFSCLFSASTRIEFSQMLANLEIMAMADRIPKVTKS